MPYIKQGQATKLFNQSVRDCIALAWDDPGALNYLITQVLIQWIGRVPTYRKFNAAVGAIECAKLELYRRMIVPYEDRKKQENGDVYPEEI